MVDDQRSTMLTERLTMATHNAEHVKLTDSQRLSVRNLNESFAAVARKAVAVATATHRWAPDSFGHVRPSHTEQLALFDLHREFFDLSYSTMSSLAACLNRLPELVQNVKWSSNEKFLGWRREERSGAIADRHVDVLLEARNFRTIYTHPGQWKPFDWATEASGTRARVVLHGIHPPLPPGATTEAEESNYWLFPAPSPEAVVDAFEACTVIFFGALPSVYEEDTERCQWEAQGRGSAPFIKLENLVSDHLTRYYATRP